MAQLGLSNQRVSLPNLAKAMIQALKGLTGRQRRSLAKLGLAQNLNAAGRMSVDRLGLLKLVADAGSGISRRAKRVNKFLCTHRAPGTNNEYRGACRDFIVSCPTLLLDHGMCFAPPDGCEPTGKDNHLIRECRNQGRSIAVHRYLRHARGYSEWVECKPLERCLRMNAKSSRLAPDLASGLSRGLGPIGIVSPTGRS